MSDATAATPSQHVQRPATLAGVPATLVPESGWHLLRVFYRVDRAALLGLSETARIEGKEALVQALTRHEGSGIEQLQCFAVPGHKADFGFLGSGPDLKALHAVQTAIQASL